MREREYHSRSNPDGKVPFRCQANAWRGLCQRELPTVTDRLGDLDGTLG
jgi:hypothetical protein